MVFPSSVRYRQTQQESSPPPPGSGVDSFYGVRSLNGSMCDSWSSDDRGESPHGPVPPETGCAEDDLVSLDRLEAHEKVISMSSDLDHSQSQTHSSEGASPVSTIRPPLTPPIPSTSMDWTPTQLQLPQPPEDHYLISLRHMDDHPPADLHSEPSSPASFTSLPSYVASLSSLSRTSSPARSAFDLNMPSRHLPSRNNNGHSPLSDDDLVLPTISLPSSSLHMTSSFKRWEQGTTGTSGKNTEPKLKIAVLGDPERSHKLIQMLKRRYEISNAGSSGAEVSQAEIVVSQGGQHLATLVIGHNVDKIVSRLLNTYTALHDLLNPVSPPEAHDQLAGLVEGYASASDWIHLVVSTDNADALGESHDLHGVSLHLPLDSTAVDDEAYRPNLPTPLEPAVGATPRCDQPTPTESYFHPRQTASLPSSRPSSLPSSQNVSPNMSPDLPFDRNLLEPLDAILSNPKAAQQASIDHFISWHHAHLALTSSTAPTPVPCSMESSFTSTSPGASLESDTGPIMPTVARAQGGGEWEASLSRRVAKRRQSEDGTDNIFKIPSRGRGQRGSRYKARNRSPSTSRDACKGHLFPRTKHSNPSGSRGLVLGLGNMVERVFSPFRQALWSGLAVGLVGAAGLASLAVSGVGGLADKHSPGVWRKVAVACAVAVAVGWGYWNVV